MRARSIWGLGLAVMLACGGQEGTSSELDDAVAESNDRDLNETKARAPANACVYFPRNHGQKSGFRFRKRHGLRGLETTRSMETTAHPVTVSLTFDDGLKEHAAVGDLLKSRGVKGTFYVNGGRMGFSTAMTISQVRKLQTDGHEVGGHTIGHADLLAIAPGDVERQICNDRAVLLSFGINAQSFAYPFGNENAAAQIFAQSCGYTSARTVGPLDDGPDSPVTETIPAANPFAIRTTWSAHKDTTLDEMKQWIIDAGEVGGWMTLVFHGVCDTGGPECDEYSTTTATLTGLVDWLNAQPNVAVKTIREVTGGTVQPVVIPANAVLNPSLESDIAPANGDADYWSKTWGWGTNTKSWTRVVGGHTGTYAQKLDVTSFSTGQVFLSPTVDTATPPVIPGRRYAVTGWYKSNVTPKWMLAYRDQNGIWRDFPEGPALPAAADWTQASITTPVLPAGSTGLNFGLELVSVGSLTTDDYAITEAPLTASTSTAVASSINPSTSGQSVTFTATITSSGGTPTGSVTFKDGATTLGTGTLSGGQATLSTAALAVGTHAITAAYAGNASFAASTSTTLNQSVNTLPAPATSTTVASSLNPSTSGQSVTFTATVTSSGGTPTGSVTFKDGATTLGTGTLSGGQATLSTAALAVGTHAITVAYAGNASFAASTSTTLNQTVNSIPAAATSTAVASSLNPSTSGQSVTFTATVSTSGGTPTGTVTFQDGPTTLGTGTLSGGQATLSTAALAVGTHAITAAYAGNASFAASTSTALNQTVNSIPAAATSTAVASSLNPSTSGQSVTFTATVSTSGGTPTGTVTFKDGATTLGIGTLAGGQATLSTAALAVGTHAITAAYAGNASFAASTSTTLNQIVNNSGTPTLQNPSFETADASGTPTCWQRTLFGTNNALFSRVTDAHEGSFAEKIDITAYTNGTGRTLPKQDTGTCAVPAVAGTKYTVTAWYKTTGAPVWVFWYRSASGAWTWWAQSAPLGAAAVYTQASFTTPALPAGATHISFALSLYGVGSLTMDDFAITAVP